MSPPRATLALALLLGSVAWASGRDVAKARALLAQEQYEQAETLIQEALRKKQDVETMGELRGLLDDARYGAAEKIGTIEALQTYLQAAPPSTNANSAAVQVCEMGWNAALASARVSTDPAPLLDWRDQNPRCPQTEDAWLLAGRIDMDRARAVGTSAALREAIARWKRHPSLPDLIAEEARVHEAEARAADTPEALVAFLDEHPDSPAQVELRGRVETLTWQRATAGTDAAPVLSYLEAYPNGPHQDEAHALLRQRATGLMLLQGEDWGPLPEVWPGPSALIYKAEPAAELHAPELVLTGLHRLSDGSSAASPVLDPRVLWAYGRLPLEGDPDRPLRIAGSGPGPTGEWTFKVPFALQGWAWRGTELAGVRLTVVDHGQNLASVDLRPGSRPVSRDLMLVDHLDLHSAPPDHADGFAHLESAVRAYLSGSAAWRVEVAHADGVVGPPSASQGDRLVATPLLVAWGDASNPPGSAGNAIVPLLMESSSRPVLLRADANRLGTLAVAGGRSVGSVRFDGTAGTACGAFGLRGQLNVAHGVSASALLSNWLYIVGVDFPVRAAPPLSLERVLARWPSLAEVAGPNPAAWLRDQLASSATNPARVMGLPDGAALDLDADGLPDWIRALGDHLVVLHMDARGKVSVSDLPLSSDAQVELVQDLDADGLPDLVTRQKDGDITRFQVYSTRQKRVFTTVLGCGG